MPLGEDELAEEFFQQLLEGGLDLAGIPITPLRLAARLFRGFDDSKPQHRRAAKQAFRRYVDYSDLPSGFFDYGRF